MAGNWVVELRGEFMKTKTLFLIFSLSTTVYAGVSQPEAPQYEECKQIEVKNLMGDSSYFVNDKACLGRNDAKRKQYNAQLEVYQRSNQIISTDSSTLNKPQEPKYEECGQNELGFYNYACAARNQAKAKEYNKQSAAYNDAQQRIEEEKQKAQTDEQKKLAQMQNSSATGSLAEVEQKNKQGSKVYGIASIGLAAGSAYYAFQFASTPCGYTPGFCTVPNLVKSIGLAMLSALASKQASKHNTAAASACYSNNQLSGSTSSCDYVGGYTVPDYATNPNAAITSNFDSNGNCIASDKTTCDKIKESLPAGANIKDIVKGASTFASNAPFKFNKDGTVTSKDGNIYKPSDFADVNSMMAAGMSEKDAKALMADLGKAGLSAPQIAEELKANHTAALDKGAGALSEFGASGGGTQVIKSDGTAFNGSEGLGSKDIAGGKGKRKPSAAEGLTRDFNGESIGAAGEDIFSMMNRRYKVKTSQDAFISK